MNILNSWTNEDDDINWIPYPYKYNSTVKQSEAQRSYRMKFSLANSILGLIRSVIKLSFVRYDKGRKSGYNTAIGLFLENAVRGDYPNLEVNFSVMQISKGTIPALSKWEFSVNGNNVSLTWVFEKNKKNAYGDDKVQVILFNLSKRSFTLLVDLAKRGDEIMDHSISSGEGGDYVAWAFITNRTNTNSSNSHYLGKFEV